MDQCLLMVQRPLFLFFIHLRAMSHALKECMAHSMRLFRVHQTCGNIYLETVLFSVLVLAGLVCNAAAGLACALAGGLALAAAAVDSALCHITGIQCNDMFHDQILSEMQLYYVKCVLCVSKTCSQPDEKPVPQVIRAHTLVYYMNSGHKSQRPVQTGQGCFTKESR